MRQIRLLRSSTAKTWDGKLTFANCKSTMPITGTIAITKTKQVFPTQTTRKLWLKLIQRLTLTRPPITRPRTSVKPLARTSRKPSRKLRPGRKNTRLPMISQTPSSLSPTTSETSMASISPTHFATRELVDLATLCLSHKSSSLG